jgi:pSer/pThr/pTyr-binding forkhead associated (FHA) protein
LFQGEGFYGNPSDKMIILKNGVEVHEVPIEQLNQETVIGRHPEAHIQLEAYKLGLYHIVLRKKDDRLYVEAIDEDYGTLLNRKKIKAAQPVLLRDGSLVDIPGYQLRFRLASARRKKPSMQRNWRKFLPISITRLPLPQVRC